MVRNERRAERTAGVAGRGLQPKGLERALAQQLAVRDAVERYTARESEIFLARFARDAARELEPFTASKSP